MDMRCCSSNRGERPDLNPGKAILWDIIKATVGFEKLGEARTPAKEPDPHVRPARESAGAQLLRRDRLSAKAGRRRVSCHPGAAVRNMWYQLSEVRKDTTTPASTARAISSRLRLSARPNRRRASGEFQRGGRQRDDARNGLHPCS